FKAQNSFSQRKQKTRRKSLITSGKSILQHGFKQKLAAPSALILCLDCGERSSVFRERYQQEDREPR
ncbi:2322_t:CDS:2, partial [Gigaspora rosea]